AAHAEHHRTVTSDQGLERTFIMLDDEAVQERTIPRDRCFWRTGDPADVPEDIVNRAERHQASSPVKGPASRAGPRCRASSYASPDRGLEARSASIRCIVALQGWPLRCGGCLCDMQAMNPDPQRGFTGPTASIHSFHPARRIVPRYSL